MLLSFGPSASEAELFVITGGIWMPFCRSLIARAGLAECDR